MRPAAVLITAAVALTGCPSSSELHPITRNEVVSRAAAYAAYEWHHRGNSIGARAVGAV